MKAQGLRIKPRPTSCRQIKKENKNLNLTIKIYKTTESAAAFITLLASKFSILIVKTVPAKNVDFVFLTVSALKHAKSRKLVAPVKANKTAALKNANATRPKNNVFPVYVAAVSTPKTLRTRKTTAVTPWSYDDKPVTLRSEIRTFMVWERLLEKISTKTIWSLFTLAKLLCIKSTTSERVWGLMILFTTLDTWKEGQSMRGTLEIRPGLWITLRMERKILRLPPCSHKENTSPFCTLRKT